MPATLLHKKKKRGVGSTIRLSFVLHLQQQMKQICQHDS